MDFGMDRGSYSMVEGVGSSLEVMVDMGNVVGKGRDFVDFGGLVDTQLSPALEALVSPHVLLELL